MAISMTGYRTAFIAIALTLSHAATVTAGPFEDANAAYEKGDYATALQLWRPLADQGDASAQIRMGASYADGSGVTQSYPEAMNWFRKAAEQGNARAQFNLGTLFYNGQGSPRNYPEALKWFKLAADQGNPTANRDCNHKRANDHSCFIHVFGSLPASQNSRIFIFSRCFLFMRVGRGIYLISPCWLIRRNFL